MNYSVLYSLSIFLVPKNIQIFLEDPQYVTIRWIYKEMYQSIHKLTLLCHIDSPQSSYQQRVSNTSIILWFQIHPPKYGFNQNMVF